MREARPLHQACPHVLAPVSQGASVHAGLLSRPGPQGVGAQAADPFHRLSAREIRAQIIGNVITDDTHWSQHFRPDGTLHAIALSRLRQGTWHIDGNTLCRTLTRRGKTTTTCSEVWMWKDRVEYREQGVTVMEGFVRKAWR